MALQIKPKKSIEELFNSKVANSVAQASKTTSLFGKLFTDTGWKQRAINSARNQATTEYMAQNQNYNTPVVKNYINTTTNSANQLSRTAATNILKTNNLQSNMQKASQVLGYIPGFGAGMTLGGFAAEGLGKLTGNKQLEKDAADARLRIDLNMNQGEFNQLDPEMQKKLRIVQGIGVAAAPLDFVGAGGVMKSGVLKGLKTAGKELITKGAVSTVTKDLLRAGTKQAIKQAIVPSIVGGTLSAAGQQYLTGKINPLDVLKSVGTAGAVSLALKPFNGVKETVSNLPKKPVFLRSNAALSELDLKATELNQARSTMLNNGLQETHPSVKANDVAFKAVYEEKARVLAKLKRDGQIGSVPASMLDPLGISKKNPTPQVSKTPIIKGEPSSSAIVEPVKPRVSIKTTLTTQERSAGVALGFSEKEIKNMKVKYNNKLEANDLIRESNLTPEDLGQLSPKEQSALANIDPKFNVKEPSITITSRKAPEVKSLMEDISRSVNGSQVRGQTVTSMVSTKARQLGVNIDQDFIRRYQKGMLNGDAEQQMGKFIKDTITDPTFKLQQVIDPAIQHRKNYIPQTYKQDATTVEEAIRKLNTKTKSAVPRSFNTYEEAAQFGLNPKHQTLDKILGENVAEATKVHANRQVIDNGLKNGIFSTSSSKGVPVQGFFDVNHKQVYAAKEVADMINSTLQTSSTKAGRVLRGAAEGSSIAQDVMLQGGIPGTNFNFFVAGQAAKDTTRNIGKAFLHPIQAIKQEGNLIGDLFRGKAKTQARFSENAKFIKELSDNGLNISHQSNLYNEGKSGVRRAWNTLGNNPTFGRYQPNRMLSTAKEVYNQSVKKLGHQGAVKLAAETTKKFNGLVDHIAKGESKIAQDAKSLLLFAPKYRESIINALGNVVKSVFPKNWKNATYAPSRQLLAGMVATLGAYELLNRQLTGHSMTENRQGQELSLEIPYGEKDDKGNQQVINIPFMPGFMTIPRAIVGAGTSIVKGDVPGVMKEVSKMSSAPVQIAGNLIANRDYFDRPIYTDEQTAANEGIGQDNALQASIKIGAYVGGQLSPAWVRGVIGTVQGKPLEQNIAVALEAPIRFGKHLNPTTEMYFKDRDEIYNLLDKNNKAVWDSIYPRLKNSNGEYMVDKTVDSGLARASNFLNNPEVLAGANEMARRAKARGEAIDPFYDLTGEQQRIALRIDTLPPKDPNKTVLRAQNEWYQPYTDERSKFFDSLPAGDPNKPKGPITYPEPNAEVAALQSAYYQLTDSTMKRQMITDNPEIAEQFAKEEQYSRSVRAAKNLPQYDQYPEPTKEVQNLIDFYMGLPQKESNGKSKIRSAWIKSHPTEWGKMSEQFDKQSIYNLQQDASIAAFEGQDLTDKGIKAIAGLGGGSGSSFGSYAPSIKSPYSYRVALKAGGSTPTANKSKVASITLRDKKFGAKVNKPKVTLKKSQT